MNKFISIFLATCFLMVCTQTHAGKLYRWKDANGGFYFSDKVPPKDSKYERATLNDSGRTISIKDAAKTPKQINQLEKIKALKETQKTVLKKQLAEDEALLKTFQSEVEIETLIKGKVEMLDSHIDITSGQSDTLKNQLIKYQKSAANYERSGKKISKKTLENIDSAQSQFDKNQAKIAEFEQKKYALYTQLERETSRFKLLEKQALGNPKVYTDGTYSLAIGELSCKTGDCSAIWGAARAYVIQNANTKIAFESKNLLLTNPPKKNIDKVLSLLAQTKDHETLITLDISCTNNTKGRALCKSPETTRLISSFTALNKSVANQ